MPSKPASRNLFVAGLHPSITDPILEHAFTSFGTVVSAKVMVDLITAKSRRFGFVLFESEADAVHAQAKMNGVEIAKGSRLTVEFSTVHSTDHLTSKSSCGLYVRNIPSDTPLDVVKRHFHTVFGPVAAVDQLPDTAAGASGRFFVVKVTFVHPEHAAAAEKATQCGPNVFATPNMTKVPPLLAKLAEDASTRLRRMAESKEKRLHDDHQFQQVSPAATTAAAIVTPPFAFVASPPPLVQQPPFVMPPAHDGNAFCNFRNDIFGTAAGHSVGSMARGSSNSLLGANDGERGSTPELTLALEQPSTATTPVQTPAHRCNTPPSPASFSTSGYLPTAPMMMVPPQAQPLQTQPMFTLHPGMSFVPTLIQVNGGWMQVFVPAPPQQPPFWQMTA